MKKVIVITRWDDDYNSNIKIAKLLNKYGLKGSFYISPEHKEFNKFVGEGGCESG